MLIEGGIATQASVFQCQPGLKTSIIFPVILCSFPSLGPGDQIGNLVISSVMYRVAIKIPLYSLVRCSVAVLTGV